MARIFYQFTTISIIIIYNYQISNYIKNISDKNILGKRDICYNLVCKKIVWEIQHNNMSLKNCYEKCHIVAVSFTILESTSYSMEKFIWRKKQIENGTWLAAYSPDTVHHHLFAQKNKNRCEMVFRVMLYVIDWLILYWNKKKSMKNHFALQFSQTFITI